MSSSKDLCHWLDATRLRWCSWCWPLVWGCSPVQQVISNLLTNAWQFTPEHCSVEVRLDHIDDRARIVVRDSGIGISPDLLPRIFDRFEQGDSSTTRTHSGLGLGLAIVKYLVEQHGGQISAASGGSGCGSTFTVTFPLVSPGVTSHDRPRSPVVEHAPTSGVGTLVVDDAAEGRAT